MIKRLLLVFFLAALAVATAKTYSVELFQPTVVAGTELRAGEYRLSLDNNKVVISNGKQSVETTVQVEQSESKYSSTSVRLETGNGTPRLQQIRLGGTKLRLVFN